MTKILFVQRDPFMKMGIASLSAVLKRDGHRCDLLIQCLEKDIFKKTAEIRPDAIAFSITTSEYPWFVDVAGRMRRRFNCPIICGGAHPTFYTETINEECVDMICVGEGEGAISDLAHALDVKTDITKIKNLIIKRDGRIFRNELRDLIDDLDGLPFPDRSIYDKYDFFKRQTDRPIMTSRGCPFKCTFCFNRLYNEKYKGKGRVIRRRSAQEVVSEIRGLSEKTPHLKHIFFLDDTFILSTDWVFEFLEIYKKEVRIPFSCTARANLISEDLIKNMKNANCFSIRLGLESADNHARNVILDKGITDEEIIRSSRMIKDHGIKLLLYNMIGIPGESLGSAFKTFELNRRIRPTYAWCSLLQPYPGTEIYEYAVNNGYMDQRYDFSDIENSYFMDTPIKMRRKDEMTRLQKIFSLGVFLRLPSRVVALLIKLPLTRLYEMIFQINYAFGISRVNNIGPVQLMKTAFASKNYFKR